MGIFNLFRKKLPDDSLGGMIVQNIRKQFMGYQRGNSQIEKLKEMFQIEDDPLGVFVYEFIIFQYFLHDFIMSTVFGSDLRDIVLDNFDQHWGSIFPTKNIDDAIQDINYRMQDYSARMQESVGESKSIAEVIGRAFLANLGPECVNMKDVSTLLAATQYVHLTLKNNQDYYSGYKKSF